MKLPLDIPLIVRQVRITGPKGSVMVDLIFDTGAVFTALSWSIAKAIGYDPAVSLERREIVTANGIIEVPKLIVSKMAVGDVEARNVEIICHDIPELVEVKGLLGLSFLKHFRTVIDYREKYLEIT